VITGKLNAQKWTIPGNKTIEMNKLINGETIAVTTQRGKTIKIKFEGGILKQA
jgi:endonuclease YncB( thermonuclease family)